MKYDTLSRNTVKITLTEADMRKYSISSDCISGHTAETKRTLTDFVNRLKEINPLFPEYESERLFLEEKSIIEEIVRKEDCVIVGRCGSYIFKDRPDCLKVFVYADKDYRIDRTMREEKVSGEEAEELLKKSDKRRSSFYNTHTGQEWGQMQHFDLCLDSGKIGIDRCVEILEAAVKK